MLKKSLVAILSASALAIGALGLSAESASAASTWKLKATCSSVNIRANSNTSAKITGVAYKGDLMNGTKVDYKGYKDIKVDKAWIYGKVVRKDHKVIYGWAALKCFNPYEQ
ncbi:hypothetical protein ABZ656_00430 [Streptomyces sp. NPDC007095]|jgi:hypothetical protein|uniref:hypothetical protein n=1 Tax=Streptomyces sp. NPDC007095 TaxID=3154482 RepID=UPI000C7053A7